MKQSKPEGKELEHEHIRKPSLPPKAPYFYYRDFSDLPDPDPSKPVTPHGRIPNFPAKMMAILSRPDLSHIISWMPHGRSWKVHKPREFEVRVIPAYFEHSKFSSFIRQANGWGFRRMVAKGPDRNAYYHETFLRGMPHLIKLMKRPTVTTRPPSDAATEPDFYRISEDYPLPEPKPESEDNHEVHLSTSEKKIRTMHVEHRTKAPDSPLSSSTSSAPHGPTPYAFQPPTPEHYPVYQPHPGVSPDSYSYSHQVVIEVPALPNCAVVASPSSSRGSARVVARAVDPLEALTPIPVHSESGDYSQETRTVSPTYQPRTYYQEPHHPYYPPCADPRDHHHHHLNHWAPHLVEEGRGLPSDFEDPFAGGLSPIDFW